MGHSDRVIRYYRTNTNGLLSRPRSRKPSNPPYLQNHGRGSIDQAPDWEALILMSTPAGRLSLLRASIVLLVG